MDVSHLWQCGTAAACFSPFKGLFCLFSRYGLCRTDLSGGIYLRLFSLEQRDLSLGLWQNQMAYPPGDPPGLSALLVYCGSAV